jgi:GT2 family glycosyltransferase
VFAISRKVIDTIGLLDPGYWPIYYEEVDYCCRANKAGFKVLQTSARAVHYESQNTGLLSDSFLTKYHRNRHRFIFYNFTGKQKLSWLFRELHWLVRGDGRTVPRKVLARIYAQSLLNIPRWLAAAGRRPNTRG